MSSTTYRQLVLRLPDGLKQAMRERVENDIGLVGVEFTPVKKGSRRFTFAMDDNIYPARLVDLPCVLETQKTLDRATFFKSGDVGQMLIVYKDENAYKRDESNASGVGPQELFPDGLTPPTKNVVRRRFLKARPDRRKFKRTEVIRVESQVLKIQQEGSPAEGSDSTRRLVGNGSSSSSSAVGAGAPGGGGGGGSSSRPGGVGGGGPSRSLRPAGGDSARGRSGGGGVGNGGSSGSAGGGVGEIVTFEHEEIVEFEPWMADPKIAAVGRLEGVTIEITGPTQKLEADNAGQSSLSHPASPPLPRLFNSELLYEHPEMLLAALDLNDKDPGARNTESSEKPKVEPREKPSEKPKVEPFEKPKVEMTTAADTAMQIDDTPAAAVGGEATSSVSKPIVQASPTTAREVEQQQQDQQAPQQQAPQQQDQQVPQQQDQQAPQQQDQQAPQQQDQQAPQQQDQQAPQQQDQQALQQQAPQQQDQQVPQQQDQQAPQQQDQQAPQQQDQQAPQQQDQQAPQQQQQQNQQEEHKPQQQQQQPSRSGVATDMTGPASSGPPTPGTEVGPNSDVALNHMDDLDTLDAVGIEDIFGYVSGDLTDTVAWLEDDDDLVPAAEL